MAVSINIAGAADPTKFDLGATATLQAGSTADTYSWYLLSQPPGEQAVINNRFTRTCSLQLNLEGSYLVKLVVNEGRITQQQATAVVAVRELETGERIPALGETTEAVDWAHSAVDSILRRAARLEDTGVVVGKLVNAIPATGLSDSYAVKDVVIVNGKATISTGQAARNVPQYAHACAGKYRYVDGVLGVIEGTVNGDALGVNKLIRVRHYGLVEGLVGAYAPEINDPVYVDDQGKMSLTHGTVVRQIGTVAAVGAGNSYDVLVCGLGSAPIELLD